MIYINILLILTAGKSATGKILSLKKIYLHDFLVLQIISNENTTLQPVNIFNKQKNI